MRQNEGHIILCDLIEAIWLKRNDPNYYDVDPENLPRITSTSSAT